MNDMEWLNAKADEMMRQEEELLRKAKDRAAREGKEPFDFPKLLTLYDPKSEMSSRTEITEEEAQEFARQLEMKYYVDFGDVKTVAEFAQRLDELRS